MSQIRTAKAGDVGAFPGSAFVINNTPPIAQCQETQITQPGCAALAGQNTLLFGVPECGIDVAGKKVTVTNTVADDGTYDVISNTDDVLTIDHTFINTEGAINITIQDAGQAYLTRNESSFQRFIENQGKAHTTKGGQLFTDLADPPIDDACSDTFNPQ